MGSTEPSTGGAGRRPLVPRVPHILYGGDYNPEQWPEDVWHEDAMLMRKAGVNLVSVGIFSWARLEPEPGQYDFSWLDRVFDVLHEAGVHVDLGTATASPPPWMAHRHPETLPVTRDGTTLWPGGRQQYCPSSPIYREAAANLVRRLAERYRDHPALAMWHINNEYACGVNACYCNVSAAAFREWLQRKYGTLDALNEAWGTAFWSQRYAGWDEINPPRPAPAQVNPTQQLDFLRFNSDAFLECFEMERAILREATPDIPITTNFMGPFKPLDYWKWAAREDVVSNDSYPDPSDPNAYLGHAFASDLMRSLAGGGPWVLMEQATGAVNWRPQNATKPPGLMRLWSFGSIARGADGVMFFQWRASRYGGEKFHSGMVPHGGTGTRIWGEVWTLGGELSYLDEIVGATTPAEVALLWDWSSWWAMELDSHPSESVRLIDGAMSLWKPLFRRNVPVQFVPPGADLSPYRVVLVPHLYLVDDATAAALTEYVRTGGTVVMSFFSGIVDEHDHIHLGGYPAPFREMLGLRIEEFAPMQEHETGILQTDGGQVSCSIWRDVIQQQGAEALATYGDSFLAGGPAITRNRFGSGAAYYLGTQPEESYLARLLQDICAESGVQPVYDVPEGIEATLRENANGRYLFLLNHGDETVDIPLPDGGQSILQFENTPGTLRLPPLGVAIIRLPPATS